MDKETKIIFVLVLLVFLAVGVLLAIDNNDHHEQEVEVILE